MLMLLASRDCCHPRAAIHTTILRRHAPSTHALALASSLTSLTRSAGNTAALSFYTKSGYTPDEIDPTRIADEDGWEDLDENGEEKHCDYRILSKVLR